MTSVLDFLRRQLLPVGLLSVAVVGLVWPSPGRAMGHLPTQYIAVSAIFVCAGLLLRTDEIRAAFRAWRATTWGVLSILFVTPVVGGILAFHVPMEPTFQLGLALFVCMPTTLSSGIALTTQAKGNAALALLLTVVTNLAGIFTIPFVLVAVLGTLGQVELSAWDLLGKLCLLILLPLLVGRWLRCHLLSWIDKNRTRIILLSNLALISIPWMKFSESSDRLATVAVSNLLILVVAGLVVHATFLLLNTVVTKLLRLELAQRKAVVLMASQKTLPVALTVLALIPDSALSADVKGLIAIPCITSHLGQIFVDAVIATRWSATPTG
jgi:sodium/bile acid cotransporter 7